MEKDNQFCSFRIRCHHSAVRDCGLTLVGLSLHTDLNISSSLQIDITSESAMFILLLCYFYQTDGIQKPQMAHYMLAPDAVINQGEVTSKAPDT